MPITTSYHPPVLFTPNLRVFLFIVLSHPGPSLHRYTFNVFFFSPSLLSVLKTVMLFFLFLFVRVYLF